MVADVIGLPPVHPAAAAIPDALPAEYAALKADIAQYGQHTPIVLADGAIIDGRHRYRACLELGIRPKTRDYDPAQDGESMVAFVISANLRRRHLSISQQAIVAAELLPLYQAEAKERQRQAGRDRIAQGLRDDYGQLGANSRQAGDREPHSRGDRAAAQVANAVGIGETAVRQAATVLREAPDLAERVRQGEITVNAAAVAIKQQTEPKPPRNRQPKPKAQSKSVIGGRPSTQGWRDLRGFLLGELLTYLEAQPDGQQHADTLRKLVEWVAA